MKGRLLRESKVNSSQPGCRGSLSKSQCYARSRSHSSTKRFRTRDTEGAFPAPRDFPLPGTVSEPHICAHLHSRAMLLALTAVSALAALSSPVATRTPAPRTAASSSIEVAELDELRLLYGDQRSEAAARREQADATQARLNALGAMRDRLWPLQPKLQPHDIPVITLDRTLTADALRKLFAHECCAVHVRGFCSNGRDLLRKRALCQGALRGARGRALQND